MDLLAEIKPLKQWVGWQLVPGDGPKPRKVPMDAHTGHAASSTDPLTWSTYDEAKQAAASRGWTGVGFVLQPPFVGLDLDRCIVDGCFSELAAKVIERCQSYTEMSPSGTGVHILVKGTIAAALKTKEIEVYSNARYFTVTENHITDDPIRAVSFDPSSEWVSRESSVGVVQNRPGWIADRLSSVKPGDISEGRTATFTKLIGKFNRDGWTIDDTIAILTPHAESLNYPVDKLEKTVEDMMRRYADQAPPVDTSAIPASEFVKERKVAWTIDGILVDQAVTLLAGDPGVGKSWLLLDAAFSLVTGRPWMGRFNLKQGPVLYIDEESPRSSLSSRIYRLAAHYKADLTKLPLYVSWKEGINLREPQSVDRLREKLRQIKPNVVCVDSLIRVNPAEENNATDMAKTSKVLMGLAKEFDFGWLALDHLPHPNSGMDAQRRMRGSTEKKAYINNSFLICKMGDGAYVQPDKVRDGHEIKGFEFRIVDVSPEETKLQYIG